MTTTIKISQLPNIGNVAGNTLLPVVSNTGTLLTNKATVQQVGNFILSQAGNSFPQAAISTLAQTVTNAAQPNITSVGVLTNLTTSGNVVALNVNGGNLVTANYLHGTLTTANQPFVTELGNLVSLTVEGPTDLGPIGNLTIEGGNTGEVLTTDGAGNLSWATVSGNGSYSNSNVANYLPTYTGNISGDYANFTHDVNANVVGANFLYGDASNVTNVSYASNSNNANFAGEAFNVAAANVSGLGNIATINLSGSNSNVLYGNGVFAAIPAVTLSGDGGNLSNINGANVSGVVANAEFANLIAVESVNNNFSYHVVLTTGPGDTTLHNDSDDSFQYNPYDGILTVTRVDTQFLEVSDTVLTNLVPFDSLPLNLGNATNPWNDLYLSNSTIYLGNVALSVADSGLVSTSEVIEGGEGVGGIAYIEWTTANNLLVRTSNTSVFIATFESLKINDSFTLINGSNGNFAANTNVFVNGAISQDTPVSGFIDFTIPITPAAGANVYVYKFNLTRAPLTEFSQLSGNTITLGNATISANGNSIVVDSITVTNGNVGEIGNIASINLNGNANSVLAGDGNWVAQTGGGNANTGQWAFNTDTAYNSSNNGLYISPSEGIDDGGAYFPYANEATTTRLYNNSGAGIELSAGANTWQLFTDGSVQFPTITTDLHNGGNQAAQTLKFGDPDQQVIITGPTPEANTNAQRIIIQGQAGNGTGEGGDVYLWGGDADTNGGDIKIYAGNADNVSVGYGGYVNIEGGGGFDGGGYVSMQGGQCSNGQGAPASVIGGYGQSGGFANIVGGQGYAGPGGNVNITGGSSSNGVSEYGNVNIGAGASIWTFDNTGNLAFPGGGSIFSESSTPSGAPGNTITLQPAGSGVTTNQKLMVYPTAGDGDHIHMVTGNLYETELFMGSDSYYVKLANTGNIVIHPYDNNSLDCTYTFGYDGNFNLPGNLTINGLTSVFGSNTALVQPNDDIPLALIASNSNSSVSSVWIENSSDIANSNISAVYVPEQTSGAVRIVNGNNASTINIWDFGRDGNLTLPGNTFAVNYANGTQVSLGGGTPAGNNNEIQFNHNGAFTASGNLTFTDTVGGGTVEIGNELNLLGNGTIGTTSGNLLLQPAGNIVMQASAYNLVFDITGNLTLPGNTFSINYANGTQVPLGGGSYGDSNVVTLLGSFGSNTITTTGNISGGHLLASANVLSNGYARFSGSFDESQASTAGLYVGYAGNTSRIMFGTGNTSQTFEIDNDGGNLRFYQPGSTKATLTSAGDLSVTGNITANNLSNLVQWTTAPVANTSAGSAGQAAYDTGGNLYVCVSTNTWAKFTGTNSW